MVARNAAVLCASCGARLAHDHLDTICSPCRRTEIERSARRSAVLAKDSSQVRAAFEASGLYGVAEQLHCSPGDALDVVLAARLVPGCCATTSRVAAQARRAAGLLPRRRRRGSGHQPVDGGNVPQSARHRPKPCRRATDRESDKSVIGRTRRRRSPAESAECVEFAELLDPIAPSPSPSPPAPDPVEPVDEPVAAPSRFADVGLDDDRLPLHKPKRHWLGH